MGRYSSDSEEEKKKRKKKKKKRSRSRSKSIDSLDSRQSSKQKKSKKKKKRRSRSRSRSPERRRSRSRSYERRRSRSRERYRKRSRSYSRGRYSRSRSRSRDRRRRRSRSYDSHSRSARRSRSQSPGDRRSKRDRDSKEREDPCLNIPGFSDMAPSEQAKVRMNLALRAAAAADEKIKGDNPRTATSLQDSMAFSQAIQDIENTGFSASTFKSTRGDRKDDSTDRDEFAFGTAGELRFDSHRKPVILDIDKEDLAHPNLYSDPDERMERWVQRLTQLRRKKLEGEALT